MAVLARRAICYDDFNNRYYCSSTWDSWARWLFLGLVVVAILFVFFIFSCITARRRRKLGRQPFRGTGWAAQNYNGPPPQNPPNTYYAYQQPAPPYEPNPGYRNDQSTGIELNRPEGAYHGEYAPPTGPPPAKK